MHFCASGAKIEWDRKKFPGWDNDIDFKDKFPDAFFSRHINYKTIYQAVGGNTKLYGHLN